MRPAEVCCSGFPRRFDGTGGLLGSFMLAEAGLACPGERRRILRFDHHRHIARMPCVRGFVAHLASVVSGVSVVVRDSLPALVVLLGLN